MPRLLLAALLLAACGRGGTTAEVAEAPGKIVKTEQEWRAILTPEQYEVTREGATECAFTGAYHDEHGDGVFLCVCCGWELFRSDEKFDSGTGWPSFWQPYAKGRVDELPDYSHGVTRTEIRCSRCDAHLGHVFGDGPQPTGLRYCVNSAALRFEPADARAVATFGAGCFWCTEAAFEAQEGVLAVFSGYMGGSVANPTYEQVCSGETGHAEVARIEYDPARVSYETLLDLFWKVHDPTTLNRQGADKGTQYRSVIFVHSPEQREAADRSRAAHQETLDRPIVTEIAEAGVFYPAEDYHQDYYANNPNAPYSRAVIAPKLAKLR